MTHVLKVHPQFWDGLASGAKNFEVRRDDRHFKVGDHLVFRYYDPSVGFTDLTADEHRFVTYILAHEDFPQGVGCGFVVLGLRQ